MNTGCPVALIKQYGSCEALKVDAFFFSDERTILDHGVDGADVLSDDAQGYELDGAKEKKADHRWGEAKLKGIPKEQLGDEIGEAYEKTECGADKTAEYDQAQWNLR